jgi:hypothetical protein
LARRWRVERTVVSSVSSAALHMIQGVPGVPLACVCLLGGGEVGCVCGFWVLTR